MKIYFNDNLIDLPNDLMTVSEFMKWKEIPSAGSAVAINGKLIRQMAWNVTQFTPLCHVNVISAAFGG